MGKIVKTLAVIAVAAAIAYFAPQLAPTLLSALGTTTATALATSVATTAIAAGLSIAASLAFAAFAPRPSAVGAGTPSVIRQSLGNSYIIYGKRRVGGLLIFFHPLGKTYRYFVIAVAGHRCKGVVRWYLGDEEVTVDGSGKVTSGKYQNYAWLWFYRGTDDQVAHPTFVAETEGKWTAAHRGRGTALIYAKFDMAEAVVQAGMPNITAEIEGKDDIRDPRTDTQGYTRNAALVFEDWMALPREEGGFGAYPDEHDWDWAAAQAGVCDETVTTPAGPEARYALDCYITTGGTPSEVRETLVTCCAGSFTYSGGKNLMRPGYWVPPSATLLESDLAGPITVPALLGGDDYATEVAGTYINPADLYQSADVPTRGVPGEDVLQRPLDLPHVTSVWQAQRIAEIALRKAQAERRVTWPMNIVGISIATLDTVQCATARYGLSNYNFTVASWGLSQDFSVVLGLQETSPEIYDFDPASYIVPAASGVPTPAEVIPDLRLDPATELQASVTGYRQVTLTWRAPRSPLFDTVAVVADGVESPTRLAAGLGAVMSVALSPVALGAHSYLIRAFPTDGSAPVDSDPVAVTVAPATFDFTGGTMPAGASLTRASAGTRVNPSGNRVQNGVDFPRFDHEWTAPFALRGLLVEPAATNRLLHSQDLTGAAWTPTALVANATALIESTANSIHRAAQSIAFTSGEAATISAIGSERGGSAKRYLVFYIPAAVAGTIARATFDLAAGTVTTSGPLTAAIAATAGGWMCAATLTPTATTNAVVEMRLANGPASVGAAYTGDGASGVNLSEMQVEVGTRATSRIRTSASALTRAADVLTLGWGSQGVPDGPLNTIVTFDDGSTQAVAMTVAGGSTVLTTALDRPRVRSVVEA